MPALALDIGTYSIKAIAGDAGKTVKVARAAETFNTHGFTVPADDVQSEQLSRTISDFITDHKLPVNDVRLSLPESVVSVKVIAIPPLSDAELASAIGWQAEQHIPIPPDELSFEYEVLYRPAKGSKELMRVLLVGVRKQVVERYVKVFSDLGIEPTILETQLLSVVRALQFVPQDPPTLVTHIGANTMTIGMVHRGEIVFVFNHMSGGQMLTKALQQGIGLDANQAEQYKRTYGMDESQFQGKVKQALEPGVKAFTNEIVKAMRFFANQSGGEGVQRVLLSGGTAQMPGLVQFVTEQVGVEVLVIAPFAQANGAIPETNHTALSVCMGLLLRP